MELLKQLTQITEGKMKDAAEDIVQRAAKEVKKGEGDYLMALVAKVLELDTHGLFKGDVIAAEDMIKTVLDLDE